MIESSSKRTWVATVCGTLAPFTVMTPPLNVWPASTSSWVPSGAVVVLVTLRTALPPLLWRRSVASPASARLWIVLVVVGVQLLKL